MGKTTKKQDAGIFTVVKSFRDKDNFKHEYQPGEDVSHFDKKRLEHLVSIGHVEETEKTPDESNEGNEQ